MAWDTVIGLEVHTQLKTKSKLFSGAATTFGAKANSQTSYVDAGLPGVLPVLNQRVLHLAIQFGLAIHAEINDYSYFERKNYFYPDLPKGYQISQYQRPLVSNGFLLIEHNGDPKKIQIVRAHLEEDAGKSLHDINPYSSGIDLNRAGIPLLEIVTSPCLTSADEAINYLKTLHQLVRFLGISDGNMQDGSFRCDVNISLRPNGSETLGTRVEIKNLNSFRFIEQAICHEEVRQRQLLEAECPITQETRLYCPITNTTQVLRSKENANDYRYFPDPDLLPIHISTHDLNFIQQTMPELPEKIKHEMKIAGFFEEDIQFLLTSSALYNYFIALTNSTRASEKIIINWLKGPYLTALKKLNEHWEHLLLAPQQLAILLDALADQTISHREAKQIFTRFLAGKEQNMHAFIDENALLQPENNELIDLIKQIIANYPQQVEDYRQGREKILAFFVGQVMKKTQGQASPEQISYLLKSLLKE